MGRRRFRTVRKGMSVCLVQLENCSIQGLSAEYKRCEEAAARHSQVQLRQRDAISGHAPPSFVVYGETLHGLQEISPCDNIELSSPQVSRKAQGVLILNDLARLPERCGIGTLAGVAVVLRQDLSSFI